MHLIQMSWQEWIGEKRSPGLLSLRAAGDPADTSRTSALMSRNPRYHSRFETVKQPQLKNRRDRYGLGESAIFAVLVVMVVLLRLLTHLLVIGMSSSNRAKSSHQEQAKHKAKGSEMPQELPAMSFFKVSIATDQTCYNEYQVTSASQEIGQPARCTPPAPDAPQEAPRRAPPGSPLVKG